MKTERYVGVKVTHNDLQAIFGVSYTTIYRWRSRGMPVEKSLVNRGYQVRYDLGEVLSWLKDSGADSRPNTEVLRSVSEARTNDTLPEIYHAIKKH